MFMTLCFLEVFVRYKSWVVDTVFNVLLLGSLLGEA